MALVEIFHVVANEYPVDTASLEIKEGMLVALTSAGIRRVTTGDAGKVVGVAGDTKSTTASAMPGIYAGWQNRVSDSFDETKASAKLTVYSSGGAFATDMYVAGNVDASKIGDYLIADEATGKLKYGGAALNALQVANTPAIAQLTGAAGAYPSGVPGVDINGDMALKGENTNQYIVYKLMI
jgi:hypothetical protein